MNIIGLAYAVLIAFGTLCNIARIGKPRNPTGAGEAVFITAFNGVLIFVILKLCGWI